MLAPCHRRRCSKQVGLCGGRSPQLDATRCGGLTDVPASATSGSAMGPAGSLLGGHLQIALWGSLAAAATFFLLTFLIFLCSSCDR